MKQNTTDVGFMDDGTNNVKLSPVDVHIAQAVFKNAKLKLELLQTLTPDLTKSARDLTLYVGGEIGKIITHQRELEGAFESLITQRAQLIEQVTFLQENTNDVAVIRHAKEAAKESSSRLSALTNELKTTTRSLCRSLRENPGIMDNLKKLRGHRSTVESLFGQMIYELDKNGGYSELESYVSTLHQQHMEFSRLVERERAACANVEKITSDLYQLREEHAKFVAEKKKELTFLRGRLTDMKSVTEERVKLFARELRGSVDEEQRLYYLEIEEKIKGLDEVEEALELEESVHTDSLGLIEDQLNEINAETATWQQKLEVETGKLENELTKLKRELASLKEEILKLEAKDTENMKEKKDWEDEEAFKKRMRDGIFKARAIRKDVSKEYIQTLFYSILIPEQEKEADKKKTRR